MKTFARKHQLAAITVALALIPAAAGAQALEGRDFISEIDRTQRIGPFYLEADAPYLVVGDRFSYTGIIVHLFKAEPFWQAVNPMAPASHGDGRENVRHDPLNGRVTGLSFLTLRF